MKIRISKYLSECGECSRRKAEELIAEGKVRINGYVVQDLSAEVEAGKDNVQVGSRSVRMVEKGVMLFHKPRGVVCTLSDPEGRRSVADYLTKHYISYFPVGRLDYDSSGLLVLTNDGDLANRLMHPRYGFDRVYEVRVRGEVSQRSVQRLLKGMKLEDGFVQARKVTIDGTEEGSTWLTIAVGEGKNRMVRRMFDSIGHPVMKLKRTQHGPLYLGKLQGGQLRKLTEREYEALKRRVFSDEPKEKQNQSKDLFAKKRQKLRGLKGRSRARAQHKRRVRD